MKRGPKNLGLFIAASSALLLLLSGCGSGATSAPAALTGPVVQVFTVAGGGQTVTGKVAAADSVQVSSKLGARVTAVHVTEGSRVHKGQVLVELDPTDYTAAVNQAQAGVEQAQAGLAAAQAKLADTLAGAREQQIQQLQAAVEQAQAAYDTAQENLTRTQNLFNAGAAPQSALDQAQLGLAQAKGALDQAKAQLSLAQAGATANTIAALKAQVDQARGAVNQAQAALQAAQNNLANTKITAPMDGVVASKNINPGEMAAPGVPLMTLVNLDTVKVDASVPQTLLPGLHTGQTVAVHVAELGDQIFTGTITFLSPVSDQNNNTFPVEVTVPNSGGQLRAGMVADVTFAGGEAGVEIPVSTLVKQGGQTAVFKLEGDKARRVAVQGKQKDNNWFIAASGVNIGDKLVIQPPADLKDGAQVQVQGGKTP
ncbi:efflux RND transporter periplasmic adaptor subunit [Kyrpidia spormannii]|uniref:Efflux RND transporter periplasmic adaptor subunit n=1 Tax=Kyrpidia spormannii TaxID=2055160 RepID=A0A2K8NA27_9BACL|nr:efflux RND transporter periplasmic adaptor subunit [Kyrpidia spormannii]ATY86191.1 efflux RND transporter periplasmic adaptor subunit [Kyrpidia spormannii]